MVDILCVAPIKTFSPSAAVCFSDDPCSSGNRQRGCLMLPPSWCYFRPQPLSAAVTAVHDSWEEVATSSSSSCWVILSVLGRISWTSYLTKEGLTDPIWWRWDEEIAQSFSSGLYGRWLIKACQWKGTPFKTLEFFDWISRHDAAIAFTLTSCTLNI